MRPMPIRMPSSRGSAPPDSEVPEPRGTIGTPSAWENFKISLTCSRVDGSTQTKGVW